MTEKLVLSRPQNGKPGNRWHKEGVSYRINPIHLSLAQSLKIRYLMIERYHP
jgi:hypothetical protein